MSDLAHRITDALLSSELLPTKIRMRLMRAFGYDIHPTSTIWGRAMLRSKKLRIGKHVFINVGFFFDGCVEMEIGDNVRIGQFVRVITATHDIGPPEQRCLIDVIAKPVTIGSGSWIGCNVTLLPGAHVARGCVIGAGSLVTKPTVANGVYAGSPARLIRRLESTDACAVGQEALVTS